MYHERSADQAWALITDPSVRPWTMDSKENL